VQHPFLKPRRSQEFQQRFGRKAVAARSAGEAGRWVQEARGAGMELVVQDYVPGPARAHYFIDGFVDRTGTMRARMARRRLRTYPEPFGDSSSMETIPLGDVDPMVHALDRLLPALNYRGVFNAQFKHDDRDGVFKLLDLNCRPWGGIALATACGVHLPVMCYRDALELDVETVREYPVGTRWVYQPRDLLACCGLWRAGVREPARWLRTWSGAVHPIWSRHDPRPAIAFAVEETAWLAAGRSRTGRSPWPSSGDNRDGDERDGHGEQTG
jgi:predicted ATP-grasp superfamily ATP-dependent carboligase